MPSLEVVRAELNAAVASAEPGLPAANELCLACEALFDVDGAAVSMVFDGSTRGTFGSSNEISRRVDEYQFTFGEGPCLDAAATGRAVLAPDLDSVREVRWPGFVGAALGDGIRSVFAVPINITSVSVGALDLFRTRPGPLADEQLAGALMAAELASLTLLDSLASDAGVGDVDSRLMAEGEDAAWGRLAEIDRIEVYQATGMLIAQLDVDAAEALVRLRGHAIATGQTASEVAWAIVERRLVLPRDDDDDGTPR
ncbi:GAF and ANTAR domain-containing protein [Nocardioides sp. 1609]|uniref:GAF and ANTAR domain-containing protein n=1 Tax=Nocardioides sp. 1609 TaxID=2508327 RepID=UPI00106F4296|nr:GAF and ANTAR domain-containing protein [Nocardioides sp. 1609]